MPNPNELQHQFKEWVESRNEEYRKMEESLTLTNPQALLVKEMVSIKDTIKHGYLSKSTKLGLLEQLRAIEAKLGIEGNDYNSEEF